MTTLSTSNVELKLIPPDVERDAPISVRWLEGSLGRETLKLMGNTEENNRPSTLKVEKERIRDFIESSDQLTWMIQFRNKIVGSIWVDLKAKGYLLAPSIHIMIGNPDSRGHGVGTNAFEAVIDYLRSNGDYEYLYSRHLSENQIASKLLDGRGFVKSGGQYKDKDGLTWQNVKLKLAN